MTAEIEKIEWSTFTGVLGNEVVGIWEKYTNKTDVNAADAHFAEKCIVTGDGIALTFYLHAYDENKCIILLIFF